MDKTFCFIFGNRSVGIDAPNLSLGNVQIEAKNRSRLLGIILDDNLKVNKHITLISDKVSKSIGILYKLQMYLPFSCFKQFHFSLIHPYLIITWGGACSTPSNPLVILEKSRSQYNQE